MWAKMTLKTLDFPCHAVCCDGSPLSRENTSSPGEEKQGGREAGQAVPTNTPSLKLFPNLGLLFLTGPRSLSVLFWDP